MEPSTGVKSRSFAWLNATQFFGALNDNLFRILLVVFLTASRGEGVIGSAAVIGSAVFVVPFLLFSAAAGALADRFSKRDIIVWAKCAEVPVMALGCAAFFFQSAAALYAVLFLVAAQSAFFGPSKYGIIPELVGRERLSRANGFLQAFTFLAIIAGIGLALFLSPLSSGNYVRASFFCVIIAVAGLITSLPIERTPLAGSAGRVSWLFVRDIRRTLSGIRADGYLLLAVIGSAYFLLIVSLMQLNLVRYGIVEMGLSEKGGVFLFLLAALGVVAGALLAGRVSGRNVVLGVLPIGAIGLTFSTVWLSLIRGGPVMIYPVIVLMGVSAGLFIVPIQAWIQFRSPRERLGEIIGAAAFLGGCGVLLASGMIYFFAEVLGMGPRECFVVIGWMTLLLTIVALYVLPGFLLSFICLVIMRTFYRLRTIGAGNIPLEGPALLVCNHVSLMDALLLIATQQRRIRFLAERGIYEKRWLRLLMRLMGVIPISYSDSPRELVASLREAHRALDEGFLVCIFAEGAVTRIGNLLAFKAGFEHIVKGTGYPIVPIYLGGAWGSIFSYYHGMPLSRWPMSVPYPVTIIFGRPLPSSATAAEVRREVMELSCDYFNDEKVRRRPLGECFVTAARENWRRQAVSDSTGKRLTFRETLIGAVALAAWMKVRLAGEDKIGILLPQSVGGVLANLAVTLLGKVAVNLNYTSSVDAFRSAVEQCGIRHVLTSRVFLEKLGKLPVPEGAIYLEDVLKSIGPAEKRRAWLKARFMPCRLLAGKRHFNADEVVTIIFSSGSTGDPKGVMLSHHNILSNIEALRMVFCLSPRDCVCGVLPFFHSFGYTATLWEPLLSGTTVAYHPNPLDGAGVAKTVRRSKATLLFATPTFLMTYIRHAKPEDFASLKIVVVGAEKLKKRIADLFEKKFGIRPREGYGATELSPIAALNIPDVDIGGVHQVGTKEGTVGQPLAGVAVRIVDPDTGEAVPDGEPGLMLIKGPNVMLGYLNRPDKTKDVLRDGWYNTGDIALVDDDGFVTITDRLSRFSKIGGEMVPHIAVEEEIQRGLNKTEQVVAVTSVPDEKKGEKLVVMYTDEAGPPEELKRVMAESGLPNLWKPKPDCYFRIEALPLLGTGKLDLKGLKQLALEAAGAEKK
ncbi:MAG: acyl-[ACP]--phospholipid O-acyltransferase [Candidatus Tritonobacter lacicola]|nr:acyl-[ACP]--phospholipid O-acyltransferase [Candidatus Tritonobacter lacicola]